MAKKIHFIGCAVLAVDMKQLEEKARNLGVECTTEYLPGGLHSSPAELHDRLQEAIERTTGVDRIAVGYGLCGHGTVDLRAGEVPLTIPKVHDCIALFLGSDAAYRKEFSDKPGTYYISAGWYEGKVDPKGNVVKLSSRRKKSSLEEDVHKEELEKKYGKENAQAIVHFLSSWQRNYQRAAFIDTGAGEKEKYAGYAKAMAEEFGWEYARLSGTLDLLEKVVFYDDGLYGVEDIKNEILFVPPHYRTVYDPTVKALKAAPLFSKASSSSMASTTEREHDEPGVHTTGPQGSREEGRKREYGLGIDAGGTYTDAVIYRFTDNSVVSTGKALTTKWDFTIGIENAVKTIEEDLLKKVELVSVSTTLATNAIVEGHGQKVGLLLMPSNFFNPGEIKHTPKTVIKGRMDISGNEIEPVDPDEIRRVALSMKEEEGAEVFAVSGYGGSVNPVHELTVKQVLMESTGLYVCCGHELSDILNFFVRANTAVLNARIIPLLEAFLADVTLSLDRYGITAPIMVVKGDGSLMSETVARERPIETILSGPAASIAGARFLTGIPDATVIDVGGTTSDIGTLSKGKVAVQPAGARVGGWRTHVKALDMNTVGLGGDSEIKIEEQVLTVGPRRIAPVSWLGEKTDAHEAIEYLQRHMDDFSSFSEPAQLFSATSSGNESKTGHSDSPITLTPQEDQVLRLLRDRPHSLLELGVKMGMGHWMMVPLHRLEERHLLQRSGLTPTDLLHYRGQMDLWNSETAERYITIVARRAKYSQEELTERVFEIIEERVATELLRKQLVHGDDLNTEGRCGLCGEMVKNILSRGNENLALSVRFHYPVIGLGAPVGFFLRPVEDTMDMDIIIPKHAEVANAVGAITSYVTVSHSTAIVPSSEGFFIVQGLLENKHFSNFNEAHKWAEEELRREVLDQARKAGTSEKHVGMTINDRISRTADGSEIFLGRTIQAELKGIPDAPTN